MNWLYDPCTITWERCRELLTKLTFTRPPNILHNNHLVIQSVLKFYNRSIGARSSTSPQKQVKSNNLRFSVFMWFAKLYFSLFEGCINNSCELQSYTFYSLKAGSMIQMVSFTGAESTTYFIRWIHEHNFIGDNHHYRQQVQWNPKCSQHYPDDTVWGPMHWGHATSQDLLHWTHLPIALYPGFHQFAFCLCLFIYVRLSKQHQSVSLHLKWPCCLPLSLVLFKRKIWNCLILF